MKAFRCCVCRLIITDHLSSDHSCQFPSSCTTWKPSTENFEAGMSHSLASMKSNTLLSWYSVWRLARAARSFILSISCFPSWFKVDTALNSLSWPSILRLPYIYCLPIACTFSSTPWGFQVSPLPPCLVKAEATDLCCKQWLHWWCNVVWEWSLGLRKVSPRWRTRWKLPTSLQD